MHIVHSLAFKRLGSVSRCLFNKDALKIAFTILRNISDVNLNFLFIKEYTEILNSCFLFLAVFNIDYNKTCFFSILE